VAAPAAAPASRKRKERELDEEEEDVAAWCSCKDAASDDYDSNDSAREWTTDPNLLLLTNYKKVIALEERLKINVGALGDVTGDDQPVVRCRRIQRFGDRLIAGMTRVQVADRPERGCHNT
jgi:hypothetical protein